MKVLAFDTSSFYGSIALMEDERLVLELNAGGVEGHAVWLVPSLDYLLKKARTSIKEIDLFAVSIGPGSFTGLRIGVSVVKGLAWTLKKPVAGISTLEALSMNVPFGEVNVCPIMDARKKEVYTAIYTMGRNGRKTILRDSVMSPEALLEFISGAGMEGPVVFIGDGIRVYGDSIRRGVRDALFAPEYMWQVRASHIAHLAVKKSVEKGPEELSPLYLRKSDAELKKQAGQGS